MYSISVGTQQQKTKGARSGEDTEKDIEEREKVIVSGRDSLFICILYMYNLVSKLNSVQNCIVICPSRFLQ